MKNKPIQHLHILAEIFIWVFGAGGGGGGIANASTRGQDVSLQTSQPETNTEEDGDLRYHNFCLLVQLMRDWFSQRFLDVVGGLSVCHHSSRK